MKQEKKAKIEIDMIKALTGSGLYEAIRNVEIKNKVSIKSFSFLKSNDNIIHTSIEVEKE